MLLKLFIGIIGNATALFVANQYVPNFSFTPLGDFLSFQFVVTYLFAGLVLTILNNSLKPVLKFLLIPFVIITLGLFSIVINMLILMTLDWLLTPLSIDGLLPLLYASFIIGIVNFCFSFLKK